jgi:hypothetical protein
VPIDAVPLSIASLAGIVAGPIVRRLTSADVSVWVAVIDPGAITLKVRERGGGAETVVTTVPTRVGSNLWMSVLTAPAPGGAFAPGAIYEYELDAPWTAGRPIPWDELSLPGSDFPTFVAPPSDPSDLMIAHASCRKPHGGGRDGLALLMDELEVRFTGAVPQPHLLVLSGDQIYADEVGHPLMPRILRVATDLVGIDESVVFGAPPPIGGRGVGTRALGYTGATANQLWSFGEYIAMYLLTWSPVLWASPLPEFPPPTPVLMPPDVAPEVTKEAWDADRAAVQLHQDALGQVRKVLANIPTLMIFDDHDVTDDWNMDHRWVAGVYGKESGRRAVTNALLAYVLCQHWGNKPQEFIAPGTPEREILTHVAAAATSLTSRAAAAAPLLGVPAGPLPSAPPAQALRDLADPGAIRYDVRLGPAEGWPVRIVLLDERTAREYPDSGGRGARVSMAALEAQLPLPTDIAPVTVIVAAAPILGTELIERILQPLIDLVVPDGARFADYESWSTIPANHQDLLSRLAAHHPTVVLSGDVHYGFSSLLTRVEAGVTTRLAQFTSSAAKNLEAKNSAIGMFSELIMRLGIERIRPKSGFANLSAADRALLLAPLPPGTALAWDDAADVLSGRIARESETSPVTVATPVATAYGLAAPDWSYTVEPVDDPMHTYDAGLPLDEPWTGWDPVKSLRMATALQDADLERISRMFVGLPMVGLVRFAVSGPSVEVTQELRCAVGLVEPAPASARHVLRTRVVLS